MGNRVDGEAGEMAFHMGSVISPTLVNVYTNDQQIPVATNSFIYTDYLCFTTQQKTFEQVKFTLASGLNELGAYYKLREPSACKSHKDTANGVLYKEPPSRPQTGCHLEQHEAWPYSLTCLPWHHARQLNHIPKPLSEDAR